MNRPTFRPAPLALAVALVLASAVVQAQTIPTLPAAPLQFSIQAQPLAEALNVWARQTRVQLIVQQQLVAGKSAPAVSGSLAPDQALARLLAGSGLVAEWDGNAVIIKAPTSGADTKTLGAVTVSAQTDAGGATEGSGLYTASSTTVGSKTGLALREVPQSVSVVARQQIEDMGLMTLPDALRAMPGVTGSQFSMLSESGISRGFAMGDANLRVDGGATLSRGYGVDNDLAFYDHVEVLRGADGLFGGNGDPGGVTNLVRKKPTRELQVIAQGQYGSDNFKRADLDVSAPLTEDGRVRGRAVLAREDREYFFDVADSQRTLAYGVLEADLTPDTTVTVGATYNKRNSSYQGYGLPHASTGEDLRLPRNTFLSGADDRSRKTTRTVFAQLTHRFDADWRLNLALNHETANQERYDHYFRGAPDLLTGVGTASAGTNLQYERVHNNAVDAALSGKFSLLGRQHDVVLGASWFRFDTDIDLQRQVPFVTSQIPDIYQFNPYDYAQSAAPMATAFMIGTPIEQSGLYGALRLQLADPLHVSVGGRYSRYHYRSSFDIYSTSGVMTSSSLTDYRDNSVFTPYLAATYELDRTWTAYASVAETFSSQAAYAAGPAPGTPLKPVTGRNYEIGVKGEHLNRRLHSAFAIYRIDRSGAAVLDQRYPASSGGLGSSCCYLDTGEVVSKGFDAELSGELLRNLQLSVSYNYNDNRDKHATTGGRYNAINPEHLFKVYASYRLPGALKRWKIGGGATAQSGTYVQSSAYVRDANGTVGSQTRPFRIAQGGYAVASALVEYNLDDRWSASLNINNLFDKTYYSTIGSLIYGSFYGAPRNAMLTVRARF